MESKLYVYEDSQRTILARERGDSSRTLEGVVDVLNTGVEPRFSGVDIERKYGGTVVGDSDAAELMGLEHHDFYGRLPAIATAMGLSEEEVEKDYSDNFRDKSVRGAVDNLGIDKPFSAYQFEAKEPNTANSLRVYTTRDGLSLESGLANQGLEVIGVLERRKEDSRRGLDRTLDLFNYLSGVEYNSGDGWDRRVEYLPLKKLEGNFLPQRMNLLEPSIHKGGFLDGEDIRREGEKIRYRTTRDPNAGWAQVELSDVYSGETVPDIMKMEGHDYLLVNDRELSNASEQTQHVFEDGKFLISLKARAMARSERVVEPDISYLTQKRSTTSEISRDM